MGSLGAELPAFSDFGSRTKQGNSVFLLNFLMTTKDQEQPRMNKSFVQPAPNGSIVRNPAKKYIISFD